MKTRVSFRHDQTMFPRYFRMGVDIRKLLLSLLDEDLKYSRMHVIYVESIPSAKEIMFPPFQTTFLKGIALIYFMNTVIRTAETPEVVINQLENHFPDDRAKRVNDDILMESSYDLVKGSRASRNLEINHEQILNRLTTQISELIDIQTGSGHSGDVMARKIATVRRVEAFVMVCRNAPKEPQALLSARRACELEAYRAELERMSEPTAFVTSDKDWSDFTEAGEDLFKTFLIDRQIVHRVDNNNIRRPFRGYERQTKFPRRLQEPNILERKRVPWNVCTVCGKNGCHSLVKTAGVQIYKRLRKIYLADMNICEQSDEENGGLENDEYEVVGPDAES